jgi:hypothetical protein
MTPAEKFALLNTLLMAGIEVRTLYKKRRIAALERPSESYVVIRYENGDYDRMHIRDFARRRFVAVI